MSTFDLAIPVIMSHEGTDTNFWVNDPADLGAETAWGWSMLTIKRLGIKPRELGIDQDDFTDGCLKKVSKVACQNMYRKHFWDKYGYGSVNDQTAATKMFDAAVNMGPKRAAEFAQRAATALGHQCLVDGDLGPKSYAAINACLGKDFVKAYADEMTKYYLAIIAARPLNAKFKKTWLKRAQWGVVP